MKKYDDLSQEDESYFLAHGYVEEYDLDSQQVQMNYLHFKCLHISVTDDTQLHYSRGTDRTYFGKTLYMPVKRLDASSAQGIGSTQAGHYGESCESSSGDVFTAA